MDPLGGFRSPDNMDDDEVKMNLMEALPGQHDSFGVERSIGETQHDSVQSSKEL